MVILSSLPISTSASHSLALCHPAVSSALQCDFGSPSPAPATPHWTSSATQPVSPPHTPSLPTPASTQLLSRATNAHSHFTALVLATESALVTSSNLKAIVANWHCLLSAKLATVLAPTLILSTVCLFASLVRAWFATGPSLSSSLRIAASAQLALTLLMTTYRLSFAS